MNEYAATQPQHSPILISIRRAEALVLAGMAFIPLVALGAVGAPISFALLGAAVVLLPRNLVAEASSEMQRLEVLRDLYKQGSELSARQMALHDLPGSLSRSESLAQLGLDITQWVSESEARMQRYPEFAGIFKAHGGSDRYTELQGRVERLREILHLAQVSRRLELPI